MKLVSSILAVTLGAALLACGSSEDPPTGQTASKLSGDCVAQITAPPGSAEYWAAFQQCANEPNDPGSNSGGGTTIVQQGCSVAVNCTNDVCTCGAGPNSGVACGNSDQCQSFCRYCQ